VPVILGPTVRIEKVSEEESDEDEDFNLDELDWRSRML
jgi:hypothetical protein